MTASTPAGTQGPPPGASLGPVQPVAPLLERRPLASAAADRLAGLVDAFTARVRAAELEALATEVDPAEPEMALLRLGTRMQAWLDRHAVIRARADELRARALVATEDARQDLVIAHLKAAHEGRGSLRREFAAATRGHMDIACVLEREEGLLEDLGARLELGARLVPGLLDRAREAAGVVPTQSGQRLLRLLRALVDAPRPPTRRAAVTALARVVGRGGLGGESDGFDLLGGLLRNPSEDPWVRRACLEGVPLLPPAAAERQVLVGLQARSGPEDHLVRARAVELGLSRADLPLAERLLACLDDDSELVRFTLADGLGAAVARSDGGHQGRTGQGGDGQDPVVLARRFLATADTRARARLAWALRDAGRTGLGLLTELLADPKPGDAAPLDRILLDAAIASLSAGTPASPDLDAAVQALPADRSPALRRRADLLLRHIQLQRSPLQAQAAELARLVPGEQARLRLPEDQRPLDLADALTAFAAEGHGFAIEPDGAVDKPGDTVTVFRGDALEAHAWRVLDELRQPAPAKRQAHDHSVGRADRGPLRVPPGGLAEATPTGVAGQRVLVDRQDGWAPELPMVEDLLHALSHDEVVVVGPSGRTRLRPPRGLRGLRTRLRLTWSFRRYELQRMAALEEDDPALAPAWRDTLARLGFEVDYQPLRPRRAAAWLDPLSFALGLGGSTLPHLSAVVLLLGLLLFGRLSWAGQRLRLARKRVPLVMGGWGTRGKSGTERLKAGLMEALGIPFLSKTTGCEAMVMHAPPGGRAIELFLYRPYDKATIWEQADVARLAPRVGARVMLWECMALNPLYVALLQGRWMHDDISTLTNAFPDHEDIQGPTGQDVAEVIAGFAPPKGQLLTTEQGMLPILKETARQRGTAVTVVPPPEATLMPSDLLSRFRHTEHPANVALVARLAEGLGLHRVEATAWMAAHVVADVGALVLHAPVDTEGRTISFAQGMSANDPLSFRHNWRTAGFEQPPPHHEWRVTVVNNRADRIPRSRMFAGLLADVAAAHRHVLIGTNLSGLQGYLQEAVEARLARLDLTREDAARGLVEHLRLGEAGPAGAALSRRLGAPVAAGEIWQVAVAVLPAVEPSWEACRQAARKLEPKASQLVGTLPKATAAFADELNAHLVELVARQLARDALLAAGPADRARMYMELVMASLVVVEDSGASGDQIIGRAIRATPPGAHLRMMGLQNIKGTGLDFAYRWVEWGELHSRLEALATATGEARERILGELGTRGYGSVMACDGAWAALSELGADPAVEAARTHVKARRKALIEARQRSRGSESTGLRARVIDVLERILDPLDAIYRRGRARWILGELAAQRMSHPRAQAELAALTKRQKGGWLKLGKAG